MQNPNSNLSNKQLQNPGRRFHCSACHHVQTRSGRTERVTRSGTGQHGEVALGLTALFTCPPRSASGQLTALLQGQRQFEWRCFATTTLLHSLHSRQMSEVLTIGLLRKLATGTVQLLPKRVWFDDGVEYLLFCFALTVRT